MRDPTTAFFVVLIIGVVAGLVFDRFAGPGWLSRQMSGKTRGMVTSALVGVAGSFIGFHLATILKLAAGGYGGLIGAVIGAVVVLWVWRLVK